jgi:hypothetical protein
METDGSLAFKRQTTAPHLEHVQSSQHLTPHLSKIHFKIILHLHLRLPDGLFRTGFPIIKDLQLSSPVCATHSYFVSELINYKSWSFWLCICFKPNFPFPFSIEILSWAPCSQALFLYCDRPSFTHWLRTGRPEFSLVAAGILLFSTTSRPVLGSTEPILGIKRAKRGEADHSPSRTKIKTAWSFIFTPCTSSCHGGHAEGQLCLFRLPRRRVNRLPARGLLIALMIEAVSTFETLVNFYDTTRRNIPQDCHLQLCLILTSPLLWLQWYLLGSIFRTSSINVRWITLKGDALTSNTWRKGDAEEN